MSLRTCRAAKQRILLLEYLCSLIFSRVLPTLTILIFACQVTELSLSLNDSNATSQSLQERLQQLQRALTNSEHDRKIMAERLEALKAAQQDAKNRYNVQQDRMQQMQNEQADAEVTIPCLSLILP